MAAGPPVSIRPADEAAEPAHRITVVERNQPFDTFGWGVVLSDQTLANLQAADAPRPHSSAMRSATGTTSRCSSRAAACAPRAMAFAASAASGCSTSCRTGAWRLGVELVFKTDVADDQALAAQYHADLVIASDGLNSRIRTRYASVYQPDIDLRQCRFVWLGTRRSSTLHLRVRTDRAHSWFQARLPVRRRHLHLHRRDPEAMCGWPMAWTPWSSPEAIAFCESLFAKYLDGNASSATPHLRGSANWIVSARDLQHLGAPLENGKQVPSC